MTKRKFNYFAGAVGATMGYTVTEGNIAAGYNAGKIAGNVFGSDEPPPKKMKYGNKGKKPIGNGIKRSSMKTTGRDAKKKKNKTVKVSKYLRAAIKQVEGGTEAKGTYKHMFNGTIGTIIDVNTNTKLNADVTNPFVGQSVVQYCESEAPLGSRTLFNQLFSCANIFTGSGQSLSPGTDLNFFTPGKILNAASVLFNNKIPSRLVYNTNDNLSTVTGNGFPAAQPGTLKIHVISSYVKVTLKNLSQRPMNVDQWNLGAKLKFYDKVPIEDVRALLPLEIDEVTAGPVTEHCSIEYATLNGPNRPFGELLQDGNIDPFKMLLPVGFQFNGSRKSMLLAPMEECTHFVKGPSGILDYSKLKSEGIFQNALLKSWSASIIFGVRPEACVTVGGAIGRYSYFDADNPALMSAPIHVEIEEVFKIKVPEITGFIAPPTEDVVHVRQLNLRKYRLSIGNFMEFQGNASNQNYIYSEENPAQTFAPLNRLN